MTEVAIKKTGRFGNWWNVFFNGRRTGWVHETEGGFDVTLFRDGKAVAMYETFLSYEHAEKAILEHYGEGVFNQVTEIGVVLWQAHEPGSLNHVAE